MGFCVDGCCRSLKECTYLIKNNSSDHLNNEVMIN